MRQRIDWVAEAAQTLQTAAIHADHLADQHGQDDVFSGWAALADQIRLVAAGLDPAAVPHRTAPWPTVNDCLTAALDALERVTGPDGPDGLTDLGLWEWHLREVRDLTTQLEALP